MIFTLSGAKHGLLMACWKSPKTMIYGDGVARDAASGLVLDRLKPITIWLFNIAMERSTIFDGKIHYFNGHFQ